jgi:membrane protease YdiL (CAAX protease family)
MRRALMSTTRVSRRGDAPSPARVSGPDFLLGLAWALVVATGLCVITWFAVRWLTPDRDPQALVVLLVAEAYLGVTRGLAIGVGGPRGVRDKLALRAAPPGQFVMALAWWALAAATAGLIYLAWGAIAGDPEALITSTVRAASDADRLPTASGIVLILIFVRAGLLTGLGEELLFRGALYGWLRLRLSPAPTVLLTALLFVLGHGVRPVLIPLVLCYGLAAGVVRHRSSSTLTTLTIHVLTDLGLFAAAVALT